MSSNNKISYLINSQVPFFVRNDHPNFIRFLEAYYEFLEQEGAQLDTLKNMRNYYDVDQSIDVFLEKFYESLLKFIPKDTAADKALLLKNIKQFYLSKGTENSVRFLIRLLFNEEISEFYYPKNDVLRVSDGKWFVEKSIKINDIKVNGVANNDLVVLSNFSGRKITGNNSNASAIVERADTYYEGGVLVRELKISNINRTFSTGEPVITIYYENGIEKVITANIFSGSINAVEVTNGGTGYVIGDQAVVESNTGTGAIVIVSSVSTGNVKSVAAVKGGAGFQVNDRLLFSGGGGTGANGYISVVVNDGSYHPNSYNIAISTLNEEANSYLANTNLTSTSYETFAFQNLAIQYTNTSNLLINTSSGVSVTTVELSDLKVNSNVFFETYDSINVNGTIVLVTSSNTISNTINVSPGLPGNLVSNSFIVIKRANANTTIQNALNYFIFANSGPISLTTLTSVGNGYVTLPTVTAVSNTRVLSLGILGAMEIVEGGINYSTGDTITFTNVPFGYGTGAAANVKNVDANGSITEVQFVPLEGHITGGAGYDQKFLPLATVNSANGNGANIIVTAILGDGESLKAVTSSIGTIEQLSIISRGSGYSEAPTLNLASKGDGTAQAVATIITGTYTYPGRYLNDDGHLSGYNFLQNRDYYQNYSYVIKLRRSVDEYRQALKELIHPAGMKLFGEYLSVDNGQSMNVRITQTSGIYANGTYEASYVATSNANGKLIIVSSARNVSAVSNAYLEFAVSSSANLSNGIYSVTNLSNNSFRVYEANTTLTGTVSANSGNGNTNILIGSGTNFSALKVGDVLRIAGYNDNFYVGAVSNNTQLTIAGKLPAHLTGNTYYRIFYPANSNGKVYFTSV